MKRIIHIDQNDLSRSGINANRVRYGLTLLEVIIALGIFLASMSAISQLISNGTQASIQGRLMTQAIMRCESKMAEVIAGVEAMEAVEDVPFADDENWLWSMEVVAGPEEGLLELYVFVQYVGGSTLSNTSFSLNRFVRDPQIWVDAALAEEEAALAAEEEAL